MARVSLGTPPLDNFNRASIGTDWTQINSVNGDISIFSSVKAGSDDTSGAAAIWAGAGAGSLAVDQYATLLLHSDQGARDGAWIGVFGRATGSEGTRTFYLARTEWNGGNGGSSNVSIHKVVNGALGTALQTGTTTWTLGTHNIELEITGTTTTTIKLLKNGVEVISATDSSSPLTSAGAVGIYAEGADWVYGDDFDAGNITGGSSIAAISDYYRMLRTG